MKGYEAARPEHAPHPVLQVAVTKSFIVGEADAGERVDHALAAITGISRSQARRWIDDGLVRVNTRACRPSQRVQLGDALETEPPEPLPSPLEPEPIALAILWEDADLLVLDKPAGLVVHPAPGHASGTLVNALLHHCADLAGVGGVLRPGIVHRLDHGTSGVLVVAKNDAAHRALAEQFRDHSIERDLPRARARRARARTPAASIGRSAGIRAIASACPCTRTWRARPTPAGACSRAIPRASAPGSRCGPKPAARTRSACTSPRRGCPIAGDPVYGRGRASDGRAGAPGAARRRARLRAPAQRRAAALRGAAARGSREPARRADAARGRRVNALRHALLDAIGVEHGFGVRGLAPPPELRRPQQVHGARVAQAADCVGAAAPRSGRGGLGAPGRPGGRRDRRLCPHPGRERTAARRWRRSTPAGGASRAA